MVEPPKTSDLDVSPITTIDVGETLSVAPSPAQVPPVDQVGSPRTGGDARYPSRLPTPAGTSAGEVARSETGEPTDPTAGIGMEGELPVWEARYSMRNFLGRFAARIILTVAWIALAVYVWGSDHDKLSLPTWIAGAVVLFLWVALVTRILQARLGHFYRLTTRRLFVSTGVFERRRDQMELIRVQDVFTRQNNLLDRFLNLGTVVVVPSEKHLPTFYLVGVDDPKRVMDLIWRHARAEQDQRTVRIDQV